MWSSHTEQVTWLSPPIAKDHTSVSRRHFFMSTNTPFPQNNGAVHNTAQILKHIMSSAMEVELGVLFINSELTTQLWHTLAKMGHPQPPMPVQTDHLTAYGVITNKIFLRATKAMEMCFHCLSNQEQQQHFHFYWRPGKTNYVNYWTKHHPATHHKLMRQVFLTSMAKINSKTALAEMQPAAADGPQAMINRAIRTKVSTTKAATRVC